MKYPLVFIFLLLSLPAFSQRVFEYNTSKNFEIDGTPLLNPFAGGINAAQFQTLDVTGDGNEELIVWDRNTRNLLVFEDRNGQHVHRPDLAYTFPPDISGYLILADFDGNGRKDLFTSSPFGIKAYKNTSTPGSAPSWEVAMEFLRLENNSNLQANNLDIPVIIDLDGDGDLDILTFNFASGDYLEYFKNTSMERTGQPGIDGFVREKIRWGNFEFCGCEHFAFGFTCGGNPIQDVQTGENLRTEHIGGHSLLLHDFTGNGVLDMLLGQDQCNTLYFLPNTGTNTEPIFNSFSTALPNMGELPEFPIFHVASLYRNDMLISTNASSQAQEYGIDFSTSIKRFIGDSNGWSSQGQPFLQQDMVDLGENARPFFQGNQQDGELLVSSNQIVQGEVVGSITKFSLDQNGFSLLERDYLNFSQLGFTDLQLLEVDGYHFFAGVQIINFNPVRKLFWSRNGFQHVAQNEISLPEITLRGNDHLEFFKEESDTFLLVARQTGELILYQANLNDSPSFTLLERNYLGFGDNPVNRNRAVKVVGGDLYMIDQRGILGHYPDFRQGSNGQDNLLEINGTTTTTRLGRNSWISSIPSALGGNDDLLLGTGAGGLIYLTYKEVATDGQSSNLQLKIYPNPTTDVAQVITNFTGELQLINPLGQVLQEGVAIQSQSLTQIDLRNFPKGVYIIRVLGTDGGRISKKIIKL
ncbi:T9SS type A sorting domain-containing protein [Litoribacter alkaliphilus]|uniref:T9SS type A sorting domain-containing protein n=1 Tax=Litoribacter ruber TaxID=702568 RepID=A0AAP2G3J1_9BACT|nr:T9SS type A sorting domain-containing protein [Litoribacter alkaliphilus]MBS9522548.1 T9SS type A sorting domain-containing protein [Litoribacter alkaliphilus]